MANVKKIADGGEGLLDAMIRLWHGSPSNHDRFDSSYIGTGEGAQAFGFGHYAAEAKGTAEYYKEALSEPRILLANKPLGDVYTADIRDSFGAFYNQITERQIDDYADMFADQAAELDYGDGDAYEAAHNFLTANYKQLFRGEGDKAVDDAAFEATEKLYKEYPDLRGLAENMFEDLDSTINDIDGVIANIGQASTESDFKYVVDEYLTPSQRAMFDEYFSHNIKFDKPDSKLYEIGVKASPEEFLDWDKPISQQSDIVRQRLGIVGSSEEIADLERQKESLVSKLNAIRPKLSSDVGFDELFNSGNPVAEGEILQSINAIDAKISDLKTPKDLRLGNTVAPARVHDEYTGRQIIEANNKSPEISGLLSQMGIKGIRYNDAVSRAPDGGRGTSNYVIFNDDDIQILNKYLRPETLTGVGLTGLIGGASLNPNTAQANPIDQLRASEQQFDMSPIEQLRASEREFMAPNAVSDVYGRANEFFDKERQAAQESGATLGEWLIPDYEYSQKRAMGDKSVTTGLLSMLEKLDPVGYIGLINAIGKR